MNYVIVSILIWACIKSVSYGIFELKQNKNKIAGISVITLSITSLVFTSIMIFLN